MKILVVCQHFYPENFRINDICYELANKGHDVTVLTGLPNYPKGKVLKEYKWFKNRSQVINNVKIKRCSLIGRGTTTPKMMVNYMWFAIFGSLKAIFMKKDFDIVYVYQLSPITMTWPAIVVKKMAHIPLVIHVLDQWPVSVTTGGVSKDSLIYKILNKLSIDAYNYADLITCSSKSFKNYFLNELKIPAKKKFLYLPSYAESDYENIEKIDDDTFDLVFAGNIGPAQSIETIVQAANILKENKKIKFHIVGDGLSRKKCEDMAHDLELDNITFYGYHPVNEMPKYYKIADAFLITMVNNEVVNSTLPAKLQSYMVAKRPIIGAISGEVANVIKESKCGLCTESLDYKNFAKLILEASHSEKLEEWSNNGYKYYMDNFLKEKCITDLEEVLETEIKKKKIDDYASGIERFIKYAFISVVSMIIDLSLFTLFNKYILLNLVKNNIIILSTICARIISSIFNYLCNKKIAFKTQNKHSALKYFALCIIQMFVSGILLQKFYLIIKINTTLLKLFIDLIIFFVNFTIQKIWVFKEDKKK
ncbi:MAG: glycosyltransferase [Bacilli bacterium]|nr:glycosyltransferase [Bacilli bacterium]